MWSRKICGAEKYVFHAIQKKSAPYIFLLNFFFMVTLVGCHSVWPYGLHLVTLANLMHHNLLVMKAVLIW